MKRSSHSSSHAAMQDFQPHKRSQRSRITDYTRDGSTACSVGGLTLGLGLGLVHSGGQQLAQFSRNGDRTAVKVMRQFAGFGGRHATELAGRAGQCLVGNVAPFGGVSKEAGSYGVRVCRTPSELKSESGGLGGRQLVHVLLHWLTTGQSSHVTSDTSTAAYRESA